MQVQTLLFVGLEIFSEKNVSLLSDSQVDRKEGRGKELVVSVLI